MAQLLVRNLDDDVQTKLQSRARRHGRSTEEEARAILQTALEDEATSSPPLGTRLQSRFARITLDDNIPEPRGQPPRPADLGE